MSTEPDDRLLDTALALTDRQPVDWASVRQALPGEAAAVDGLEAVSTIAAGHGNASADEAGDEVAAPIPAVFAWGRLEARQQDREHGHGPEARHDPPQVIATRSCGKWKSASSTPSC